MLAIVIPYFKLTFFEETLQSIAKQTDKRFKVYIGDDASPENPTDLLEKYKGKFEFIYHRFEDNLGGTSLTQQWERCIAKTDKEEWLMILGDDDYISDNYIEEFYKYIDEIEKLDINVIRFATRVHECNGELSGIYKHPKIENSTDFFYRKFFMKSMGSLSEQVFKRKAFLKYGFRNFTLGWGADDFAWLDFTEFGKTYAINEAIAFFRISAENISRSNYKEDIKKETKLLHFTIIVEKYLKKFKKEQRLPLLLYYEQLIYNSNKNSFYFWFIMCKLLFKETEIIQIIKFTRRLLIYYRNKKWSY
jgi:glycosyltransferase involved in cell wall biosynthesis